MGVLWEMHQQNSGRRTDRMQNMRAATVEQQVSQLQAEVAELEQELGEVVKYLERKFQEDVNQDGAVSV